MRGTNRIAALLMILALYGCANDSVGPASSGQGGSMARFAIRGDLLYVVDNWSIKVFGIGEEKFEQRNEVYVGTGIETIFVNGDFLYLGARDAMHIYSIVEPETPEFVFRYSHIVSCDPVVVQGDRAYVTLRSSESSCNRGVDRLDILDISDPYAPVALKSYPMLSPHGLGVDGKLLFLCEGNFGLKVFDVSDAHNIVLLKHIDDLFAYDVIVRQGLATVTGEDGIFQFSYGSGNTEVTLVGKIPVSRQEL